MKSSARVFSTRRDTYANGNRAVPGAAEAWSYAPGTLCRIYPRVTRQLPSACLQAVPVLVAERPSRRVTDVVKSRHCWPSAVE